jgi:hypothetical protein
MFYAYTYIQEHIHVEGALKVTFGMHVFIVFL